MRIVFFGTPSFAVPSLDALIKSGKSIAAVVTQPDKRKGRGHLLSQSPVKEVAMSKGIQVLQPLTMRDEDFLNILMDIKPEIIIVVAYGKIIPKRILELPKYNCINVHASLLPKYRGAAPIQWSLINGEEVTGITTMLMDEGVDTGDILLQGEIKIDIDDTSETLGRKLSELGAGLLLKTIEGIADNSITPKPQTGEPSYASVIKKEDGRIDWSKTAVELFNFVRGMYPWPVAYCHLNGERIKLIKVKPADGEGKSGRIEKARKDELLIGTGNGLLLIRELQPEGKKVMTVSAFLQGRNIKEGTFTDEA